MKLYAVYTTSMSFAMVMDVSIPALVVVHMQEMLLHLTNTSPSVAAHQLQVRHTYISCWCLEHCLALPSNVQIASRHDSFKPSLHQQLDCLTCRCILSGECAACKCCSYNCSLNGLVMGTFCAMRTCTLVVSKGPLCCIWGM